MEDSSSNLEVFPLLSPVMEAELLQQPWPMTESSSQSKTPSEPTTPAFWEENYQDLSDWCCVDPQSISRFHIQPLFQGQQDYHIGEQITSKNSGVKDNYVNLSNIKSESKEITGIGENWTVDKNIETTAMSFDGSLSIGQDQFNTVTDISDVWMNLLPTTSSINEQQTIDSMKMIVNRTENVPDTNLDLIGETIDTWFPIVNIENDDISSNNLVTNIQSDDIIMDSYKSNSTCDEYENKDTLKDILLPADVETDSFNLLSYVCGESANVLDRKNIMDTHELTTTLEIVEHLEEEKITSKSKIQREKRISKVRAKAEPYVPPLKINLKSKNSSASKRKTSKQLDEESVNYSDSDSDTRTSDNSYKDLREKNNKASRKSRINKKVKETEMMKIANNLEKDNLVLKMKVEELEKLVTSMRAALLQSALKKEK